MLKDVMIRFPAIAEPQSMGEGEPAYGAKVPIDPKGPHLKAIEDAILEAAKGKWEKDGESVLEMLKEDKKVCFERKPYKSKKNGEVYNGFEGMFTLGTRTGTNKPRPNAFDKYGKLIGAPSPEDLSAADKAKITQVLYDGCRANLKVEFWAQDNKFGRRINCSLLGAMFAGEGKNFSGGAGPAGADDFAGMAAAEPDAEDVL